MRKHLLIVRSNLAKAKGQTIAMFVLMMIAAMLFNLWLILSMDYKENFNRYHDALQAEHVTLVVDGEKEKTRSFLNQTLEDDQRVEQFALDDCLSMSGTFPYNNGQMNGWFIIFPKEVALSRTIGRAEITEEGEKKSGIYLPLLYQSEGIQIGDTLELTIGGHMVTYDICGFFNSVMMGSHNCSLTELILSEDQYTKLEQSSLALQATICSIRLQNIKENQNFEAELNHLVSAKFPNGTIRTNSYDNVIQARYISQMICSGIIIAMAFFVLLIALVVMVSNIINYIQVNLKNLGVLKATGYTSKQLICSLLLQFLSLTVTAAIVGIGLSYLLFPAINAMMISQTGIPYTVHFLPLPFFIVLFLLTGIVTLSTYLTACRIRKIEPIVALRSGVETHNFKRNHLPLAQTKMPLNSALALKTTCSSMKHNISICITMLVLSLVVVFSGLMTENVIRDMTPFINLIVGEMPDSCININVEAEDEFLHIVENDERVEKVYLYSSVTVTHSGGVELVATVSDDFSKANNQSIVFEGRFPQYENEIALAAKYAREIKVGIGDEIEISANGTPSTYLICGLTQVSNQLGRDCLLTRSGYERLGELTGLGYYLNLAEGTNIDDFNVEMQEKFAANIYMVVNGVAAIESMATVYTTLMKMIVIAILILSAIIITFVLYLLVRTLLNNKMHDYGIMKSLGYTTKQLILQTALSFLPSIILSTIVGLTISSFVINPLTALFLNGIGIVKCTFEVPVAFIGIAGGCMILFSFAMVCLMSIKIKRIAPRNLLMGE